MPRNIARPGADVAWSVEFQASSANVASATTAEKESEAAGSERRKSLMVSVTACPRKGFTAKVAVEELLLDDGLLVAPLTLLLPLPFRTLQKMRLRQAAIDVFVRMGSSTRAPEETGSPGRFDETLVAVALRFT